MKKETFFRCECEDVRHQMVLSHDEDPDWNDLAYIEMYLYKHGFFKRVWSALLYVFGRHTPHGNFEEMLLTRDKLQELHKATGLILQKMDE